MKVVALLPDSLGDFLLTTPSLQSLEKTFNPREIDWIMDDSLMEASMLPALKANRIPLSKFKKQNYQGADYIFSFPPATRYHLLAYRLGGKRRIGYVHQKMFIPRWVSRFCLTDRWICPSGSNIHELEAYGKLLELAGIAFHPEFPPATLPEIEKTDSIGIHLNSRWIQNPLNSLRSFLEGRSIVVFAAGDFVQQADRWIAESRLPKVIFPGVLSLTEFANKIQALSSFIGVDGGPVHLAAFLKIPAIVFYPAEQFEYRVREWHPWGVQYRAFPLSDKGLREAFAS